MAPHRCHNKSFVGYWGVWIQDSGRYGVEITFDRERVWLSTYDTSELAICAYDAASWRFGRQKRDLNFLEVQSRQEAEFLALEVRVASREEEKEHRCAMR
jgi:hypothetical protein